MSKTKKTTMADLLAKEDSLQVNQFKRGDVVTGTIISLDEHGALVDIGAKSEGVIPLGDIKSKNFSVGDTINVYVLTPEDREGQLLLSLGRAEAITTWIDLKEAFKNGTSQEVTITGHNKGGLVVSVNGLDGFIPFSHTDSISDTSLEKNDFEEALVDMMGQKLTARIIELDQGKSRIILSEKEAMLGEALDQRREAVSSLKEGATVTATVSAVMPYGLMLNLGDGMEGLVPREDLTWDEEAIDEVLAGYEGGEEVKAQIIDVDPELGKVKLSMKLTTRDPWAELEKEFKVGDTAKVPVSRITSYGVFVDFATGIEGMVGLSSIPEDANIQVETNIPVKITKLDAPAKQLDLAYDK